MAESSANLQSQGVESVSRLPELADRSPPPAKVLVITPCGQECLQEGFLPAPLDVGPSVNASIAARLTLFLAADIRRPAIPL